MSEQDGGHEVDSGRRHGKSAFMLGKAIGALLEKDPSYIILLFPNRLRMSLNRSILLSILSTLDEDVIVCSDSFSPGNTFKIGTRTIRLLVTEDASQFQGLRIDSVFSFHQLDPELISYLEYRGVPLVQEIEAL